MGLINFFRRLFGRKVKHKVKHVRKTHKKHGKHPPKASHKKRTHKLRHYRPKAQRILKHNAGRRKALKKPAKQPQNKTNANRKKYGIPAHHKHEASLKVAEKRSEIDEFYTEPKGKVSLKIMEKSSPEFEGTGKDDHDFVFKEREFRGKEKESIKKIEEIAKTARSSQLVTTKLDTILDIVNKTGKVRLDHLSQVLKIHEKKVEELAKILAKNNQIEIHYPFVGKPELKKKEVKNV